MAPFPPSPPVPIVPPPPPTTLLLLKDLSTQAGVVHPLVLGICFGVISILGIVYFVLFLRLLQDVKRAEGPRADPAFVWALRCFIFLSGLLAVIGGYGIALAIKGLISAPK
jgi:hypothetical protein